VLRYGKNRGENPSPRFPLLSSTQEVGINDANQSVLKTFRHQLKMRSGRRPSQFSACLQLSCNDESTSLNSGFALLLFPASSTISIINPSALHQVAGDWEYSTGVVLRIILSSSSLAALSPRSYEDEFGIIFQGVYPSNQQTTKWRQPTLHRCVMSTTPFCAKR
jgi:hypothetical protein